MLFFMQCTAQNGQARLESFAMFNKLSGPPLTNKYSEISAVKVVYSLHDKQIYYLDYHEYKLHIDFCNTLRYQNYTVSEFNRANYSESPEREYLLGNINYIKSADRYVLELSPTDGMKLDDIDFLYDQILATSFLTDNNFSFLLNSARLLQRENEFLNILPIITPSEIYQDITYQAIGKHKGYGRIRFIEDIVNEKQEIQKTDILVLDKTPLEAPQVAGILVSELQTPLSHLTILAQNRKIPIAALKQAYNNANLKKWDGVLVEYEVQNDTFLFTEIDQLPETGDLPAQVNLRFNLSMKTLVDVNHLNKKMGMHVGNKAANFGTLYKLSKKNDFKTPEGAFAIPFYFYAEHIKNTKAQELIKKLAQGNQLSDTAIQNILKEIRKTIRNSPLSKDLHNSVLEKLNIHPEYSNWRFRSSTNAEDAQGFSGAGLYTSKTAVLGDAKRTIDRAIKKVWASLWTYNAYRERNYYGMDQQKVYMGILVHRSFPDEAVNGVAITKNIYRPENYGFVVNAQLGNENVVQPTPGVVCDQFICFPNNASRLYADRGVVDILTTSSLNNGKLVMTDDEIQHLAEQLEYIKRYYAIRTVSNKRYNELGFDLEFKLDSKNRQLYIKQIRIYND